MSCVAMLVLASSVAFADKASDDFNLGVGLYRGQRWEQASETFGQFLKDFPEHPRTNLARLYYALSLNSLEKYAAAREQFATFIKADPDGRNTADARYRLGECSYYLKDYPAAIEQLTAYLEQHSGHTLNDWAKLLLGDSFAATSQFTKAEAVLKPLIADQTNPAILADVRLSLARAYEGMKRTPDAMQLYELLVADPNPDLAARALNRIGAMQYADAQYTNAAATYDRLISTYPKSSLIPSATLGAGMSWYRAGDFEKALPRFQAVPKNSSGTAQAIMMTAMSLRELGRVEESRQFFGDALKAAGDTPLAGEILFQQAQMERLANAKATSAQLYEDIADRWPQSSRVAECLFNAAELQLELAERENAERLWRRLKMDFPDVAAQPREQILLGRIFLARGETEKSIETLQKATRSSSDPADRSVAVGRYYLVRAFYEGKNHEKVVETAAMMSEVLKADAMSELRGALALAAISSLELKQYENVLKFADEFLPLAKDAKQRADVSAARAVALSQLKRFPEAIKGLKALTELNPDEPQTWTAVLRAAEVALEQNAPDDAATLFTLASAYEKDPAVKEAGFTGIAWSQFKARRFSDAEKSFAKLVEDYPSSEDAAQTLFMQARSIEEQGDAERIVTAYTEVFEKLTKDQPAAPAGSEATAPLQYAFDAGRQAARTLEKLKRIDDADRMWEKLVTHFPDAKDLDRILDEWAWMNVSAERFDRSDAIHRKLIERFPNSAFAGQARLSLAESLLEAGKLDNALKEMEAIVADTRYGETEKERALFHVIEIHVAARKWQPAVNAAETFQSSFSTSPLIPQVRQFAGDAMLQLGDAAGAVKILSALREEIVAGKIASEEWTDRVWIVLAEAALALKNYEQIDALEAELNQRSEKSRFAFQMMDIQGRRWKQQAPPNFEKAREYFTKVTADTNGEGTETAARCQFLLAETLVMQSKLEDAVKEYLKVYFNYTYDELRAQALFQAASCEAQLKKTEAAVRDFRELIAKFPQSEVAAMAKEELKKLGVPESGAANP
jgi:TolA-binding protein